MNRKLLFVAIGVLVLAALACGNGGGGGGGSSEASITIINNSSVTICYVQIAPTSEATWGEDWLGSDEVIAPGGRRTFSLTAGEYDMRAKDCDGNDLADRRGVTVDGPIEWTFSD